MQTSHISAFDSHITASWFGGAELDKQQGDPGNPSAGTLFAYSADGFTDGVIDQQRVPCLSCIQQLAFREGYE